MSVWKDPLPDCMGRPHDGMGKTDQQDWLIRLTNKTDRIERDKIAHTEKRSERKRSHKNIERKSLN